MLTLFANIACGIIFFSIIILQVLMWNEFFISHYLEGKPLLYALLHQPIIILWMAFAVTLFNKKPGFHTLQNWECWELGVLALGASFSYDIGEKLNPLAHPQLGYYLSLYGPFKTWLLLLITNLLSSIPAWFLKIYMIVWPGTILVVVISFFILLLCIFKSIPVQSSPFSSSSNMEMSISCPGSDYQNDTPSRISTKLKKSAWTYKIIEGITLLSFLLTLYAVPILAWSCI